MDATRHTPVNPHTKDFGVGVKRPAMLGLLGVGLVIVLVGLRGSGILKGVGIFQRLGGLRSARPSIEAPSMSQPVTVLVERHLKLMDAQLNASQARPSSEPPPVPLYTAQGLRDPLQSLLPPEPQPQLTTMVQSAQPAYQPPSPPPSLMVQGVLWGTDSPKAIINGQVCKVGDNVSGVTIKSITRRGIEVEFQGATYLTTAKGTMTMLSQGAQGR